MSQFLCTLKYAVGQHVSPKRCFLAFCGCTRKSIRGSLTRSRPPFCNLFFVDPFCGSQRRKGYAGVVNRERYEKRPCSEYAVVAIELNFKLYGKSKNKHFSRRSMLLSPISPVGTDTLMIKLAFVVAMINCACTCVRALVRDGGSSKFSWCGTGQIACSMGHRPSAPFATVPGLAAAAAGTVAVPGLAAAR